MKKIIAILSAITMIIGITAIVYATDEEYDEMPLLISTNESTGESENVLLIAPVPTNSEIKVQQNGKEIDFKDNEGNVVNPQIINDRTMVPFRKIFNALGVTDENIRWDGETRTVTAKKENIEIELQIDNTQAKKIISGNEETITLDAAPVIIEGRTLVPVRFIAESMNKKVGWDAPNRTVIIIDVEELVNNLEKSIPKYMQIVNAEKDSSETFSTKMNVKGNIEYKSKTEKSNNSNLSISGTIHMNQLEDSISMDGSLKATGKGDLYESLKEIQLTKLEYNLILSDNKLYMKSTTLDDKTGGKWAMQEDDSVKQLLALLQEEKASFTSMFEVEESALDIYTYQSLELVANIMKELLKDDNISIIEKGSTTTYTITIRLSDIIQLLTNAGANVEVNGLDGTIKLTSSYKKGVAQTSGCEISIKESEGDESFTALINIDGKINKSNNKITIPNDSQVIKINELEE